MSKILEFKRPEKPEEDGPWLSGMAKCLKCKSKWSGTAPVGVVAFECPECNSMAGVFVDAVVAGDECWQ